jgi:hypothetical protein
VEFLETMMAKRQKKTDIYPAGKLSSRYEGVPEHNPSHFVLLECKTAHNNTTNGQQDNGGNHTIQVTMLPAPPNANVAFAQPAARKTLSLNEAELAIQDQRNQLTRYIMHNKQNSFMKQGKPINQSKARLMGKLAKASQKGAFGATAETAENEDADDIMGDVTFRERKGNTKARKELLTSLGDGVKVDDDGVLGGAHDDEFGGKRRFGAFKAAAEDNKDGPQDGGGNAEKGNAGMAMEDGFYSRDVKAEYDEMDYDIAEQFDDDDVDVGETEMNVEGGFAQEEDDEDDGDDEAEGGGEAISGAEGLASVAGFKAMLAKVKSGETADPNQTVEGAGAAASGAEAGKKDPTKMDPKRAVKNASAKDKPEPESHLDKIFKAAENFNAKNKQPDKKATPKDDDAGAAQIGPDGLRVVTLQAVGKEIWLNHGQMNTKRLMKLFDIKKKSSAERQKKFKEVVNELCTVETDPAGGRMLVLKQHYSNMG